MGIEWRIKDDKLEGLVRWESLVVAYGCGDFAPGRQGVNGKIPGNVGEPCHGWEWFIPPTFGDLGNLGDDLWHRFFPCFYPQYAKVFPLHH